MVKNGPKIATLCVLVIFACLFILNIGERAAYGTGVVLGNHLKNDVVTQKVPMGVFRKDNGKKNLNASLTLANNSTDAQKLILNSSIRNDSLYKIHTLLSSSDGTQNLSPSFALINPTYTAAAYDRSFYLFYVKYLNVKPGINITSDLNLLTSKLNPHQTISSTSALIVLSHLLHRAFPYAKVEILSDQSVDNGSIFKHSGGNKYDFVVLGHQEYVTQREYTNLKQYVADGGNLVILDGNIFYAEINYNPTNGTITLVKGHSWAFNGQSAWRSVNERWRNETAEWVGSNYISFPRAIFQNDPFGYNPHEEQYISNPHDLILLNYDVNSDSLQRQNKVIATYELNYLKGRVIALGIYSDDIITNSTFDTYLDNLIFRYASGNNNQFQTSHIIS